jgi:Na+/proline symporter
MLFVVTWFTSRNATDTTYFVGNRSSKWYIVAYGMIGASLSGVTFMSVPGAVGLTQFTYMQVVLGYFVGYAVIATVLLPLYYRLHLTSIYSYLETRFGTYSYKTGSFFFILSRVVGAAFRMYIVVNVLQVFVFDGMGVPFYVVVAVFIGLILLYTYEGGVKTIVWTDTLQTTFMLIAVVISLGYIMHDMNLSFGGLITTVKNSTYSGGLFTLGDWHKANFSLKQFFGGMFIAIAMTGLDQEMMQKNISCKNIREAQKNMFTFSTILMFINLMFLSLGVMLYVYAQYKGITIDMKHTDNLFPTVALGYMGQLAGVVFIIGLISAAYPSADGALTALTTSFCFDMLGLNKRTDIDDRRKKQIRYYVHFGFAFVLLLVIVLFKKINDDAVVLKLFKFAGYTYGPLLGLYAFGLFSKKQVLDKIVPLVCISSPIICYVISENSELWLNGYKFGFELLIMNGLLTYIGLLFLSSKAFNNKPIK